eukprot:698648-Rhodomonas_salina.4
MLVRWSIKASTLKPEPLQPTLKDTPSALDSKIQTGQAALCRSQPGAAGRSGAEREEGCESAEGPAALTTCARSKPLSHAAPHRPAPLRTAQNRSEGGATTSGPLLLAAEA